MSVQAAIILNLLAELQSGDQTSHLFISHDLGVVRYLPIALRPRTSAAPWSWGPTDAVFAARTTA